jgi:UDP-N-acetylmuramoyl-L-alanyl-D-glutamate--2,6-diaminopimelate ligase
MLEKVLRFIEKLTPKRLYKFFQPAYHFSLALIGALLYRFPGKKIHIIAITGTKGKSSSCEFMNAILEEAERENIENGEKPGKYKSALLSTIRFKIGDETHPNMYKMTMPGRFFVQQFLRKAIDSNCKYAVIEMTSEGARFFRHVLTYPDALLFTNLSPEHIESHGGFNNYKACKLRIAKAVETSGKKIRSIVANVSNEHGKDFLKFNIENKIEYTEEESKNIKLSVDGEFNKMNALACKKYALTIGIKEETVDKALFDLKIIPGRVQHISLDKENIHKQKFEVIVDYAHTEDSLEKLYKTYQNNYIVAVLGACGGGRDSAKRAKLGKIAYSYCNKVIVTDEDPYNDDPREIMDQVMLGILENIKGKIESKKELVTLLEKYKDRYLIIENRREAINYAISEANKYLNTLPLDMIKASNILPQKPIVIISGKGTDPYIMRANGKREKWSDALVSKEEMEKVLLN